MTPQEYEDGPLHERLLLVKKTIAKQQIQQPLHVPTFEEYVSQVERAAALRVPLERVGEADLSCFKFADEIGYIRFDVQRLLTEPSRKLPGYRDDEFLAAACLDQGLRVSGNFGTVIIGKSEDGFAEVDEAFRSDPEFSRMYEFGNVYEQKLAVDQNSVNSTNRTFSPKSLPSMTHAEQAAEVTVRHMDSDPENIVILSVHGSPIGISKVVLNTARLVKDLGLAVHFQAGLKPSNVWPGVYHDAGRTK